ncbi:MAG: hypothetical protein C0P75_002555 [Bacilli bacterium]|uniref:hypothetical protein n=1 Tax=Ureibacillus sp. FSL W7-1570 TaxID=2954593 RepID=UPI001ED40FF4|nr:hypothetical protein [Bacilli bacterium]
MLKFDEQLFQKTKGQIGELFEEGIQQLGGYEEEEKIFGRLIPLEQILLNKTDASNVIFQEIKQHWGKMDLFTQEMFRSSNIELQNVQKKLDAFFSSPSSKKTVFEHALIKNVFNFSHFVEIVFGKKTDYSKSITKLNEIYLYKIGKKYFIHILYNHKIDFWRYLYAKKIYSVFLQAPLHTIQNPIDLIQQYKQFIQSFMTQNQLITTMNHFIQKIDYKNPRSHLLKEFHLLNISLHFMGGKRHYKKINKLIAEVIRTWEAGEWALTEKEQTLLSYILAIDGAKHSDTEKTIAHGKYLITNDRLINHSIELLIDYGEILPNIKPEPESLVKRYDQNYLEQIFYIVIDALVKNEQYYDVLQLMKEYEIASCTSIYEFLNAKDFDRDLLLKIEAAVQRNIAYVVDQSHQHVKQSIEKWMQEYHHVDSPFHSIAQMTSKHVCNLLKTLFATEQFDLFEQLMSIFMKYLILQEDFMDLRDFVAGFVQKETSQKE